MRMAVTTSVLMFMFVLVVLAGVMIMFIYY